jgi:ferredoxin
MTMKIRAEECIDCSACVEPCPNDAIFPGDEEYVHRGGTYPPLSDHFYIVPERCTECVGFYDTPQCIEACPVDCIAPDPQRAESRDQLLARKAELHG